MVSVVKLIDYRKEKAVVIPVNVIQKGVSEDFVMLATAGDGVKTVIRKAIIKIGQTYNDKAEILSGLKVGDQLVTVGYQDLNDGDGVTIK